MKRAIVIVILVLSLGACERQRTTMQLHELIGQTMGTSFSIKIIADDELGKSQLQQEVTAVLTSIDSSMSTWQPDSELSRFNANTSTNWIGVSAEFCDVIAAALELSQHTGGAFDITVGPLVNLWGFGPTALATESVPAEESITSVRERVGYRNLQTNCMTPAIRKLRPDVYIDLSAYAKGYAVDKLAELLDENGYSSYLVEIGGELRMRGHNAKNERWAVAIEKPADFSRTIQSVVYLTDQAMATSGDYRNFFEVDGQRYSHTIDSRTGRPVTHDVAAVTVVADSAATADALATALLVLGPADGFQFAEEEEIAAYFLVRDGAKIDEKVSSAFMELPRQ